LKNIQNAKADLEKSYHLICQFSSAQATQKLKTNKQTKNFMTLPRGTSTALRVGLKS